MFLHKGIVQSDYNDTCYSSPNNVLFSCVLPFPLSMTCGSYFEKRYLLETPSTKPILEVSLYSLKVKLLLNSFHLYYQSSSRPWCTASVIRYLNMHFNRMLHFANGCNQRRNSAFTFFDKGKISLYNSYNSFTNNINRILIITMINTVLSSDVSKSFISSRANPHFLIKK